MKIDKKLEKILETLIRDQLSVSSDAEVSIESVEVVEATSEIRIVVNIETEASSDELARRYFGLTSLVRSRLGNRWEEFFPVITPNIGHGVHA